MTSWLFFALLTPLLWGFSNVMDSTVRRNFVQNDMANTWLLAATRLPFVTGIFLFTGLELPGFTPVFWMIVGGLLWMAPFILYYKAMHIEETTRVVLLLQTLPIFTVIVAFFTIGEVLSINQFIAFFLLLAGSVLAILKQLEGIWHVSRATWMVALASFAWAVSDVIFKKYSPSFSGFWPAYGLYLFGAFLFSVLMLFPASGRKLVSSYFRKLPARVWKIMVSNLLMGFLGSLAFSYALTLGKASLTAVITGAQPLFAFGFALVIGRFVHEVTPEDLTKRSLIFKGLSFVLIIGGLFALNMTS